MQPLVSIVIPFHKQDDFLIESAQSACQQTYASIEVIVVDDCSPGKSAEELLEPCAHPRLQITRNGTNRGAASARNEAIARSQGEYIVPLDSDDFLDERFVEKTMNHLQGNAADAVYTDIQVFGEQNFRHSPSVNLLNVMCDLPGPSCFLFKRSLYDSVGGYKEDIRRGEDAEFWTSILRSGASVEHLAEPLYFYRKHPSGKAQVDREQPLLNRLRYHRDLYIEMQEEVLSRFNHKYLKEADLYQCLYKDFHSLLTEYETLQEGFDSIAARYQYLHKDFHHLLKRYEKLQEDFDLQKKTYPAPPNPDNLAMRISGILCRLGRLIAPLTNRS